VTSSDDDAGHALTRQRIVRAAGDRLAHLSQREIKRLVDGVIEEIVGTLARGETVKLHDFGSFVVRDQGYRAGRNPRTGETTPIKPRRTIHFKASPRLKEAMNDSRAAKGSRQ
jgi:integration host factor subunit alpha